MAEVVFFHHVFRLMDGIERLAEEPASTIVTRLVSQRFLFEAGPKRAQCGAPHWSGTELRGVAF